MNITHRSYVPVHLCVGWVHLEVNQHFNTRKEPYSGKDIIQSKGTLFVVGGMGGGHDSGYTCGTLYACMHIQTWSALLV